ncbi:MAG: hypothetical protein ACJAXK_000990 [Yoonia sp.]
MKPQTSHQLGNDPRLRFLGLSPFNSVAAFLQAIMRCLDIPMAAQMP